MRNYPTNSPEAAARIVALALMSDGTVDRSEILLLERQKVIERLGLAHDQFDKIFYEFSEDMLISGHRLETGQIELDPESIDKVLREITDPVLQNKTMRTMLDIVNADRRLTAREASLVAQALSTWDIELHEVSDWSIPRHSSKSSAQVDASPG